MILHNHSLGTENDRGQPRGLRVDTKALESSVQDPCIQSIPIKSLLDENATILVLDQCVDIVVVKLQLVDPIQSFDLVQPQENSAFYFQGFGVDPRLIDAFFAIWFGDVEHVDEFFIVAAQVRIKDGIARLKNAWDGVLQLLGR